MFLISRDAFDTDNGLQIKGKNNVIGTYLSILNLEDHNRSQRNSILTIQIMKNSQLKEFKYNPCMKRLVDDINKLIRNGLTLKNGMKANVRLVRFKMDNLEKAKAMRRCGSSDSFSNIQF